MNIIETFCKTNKTVGVRMDDLFCKFQQKYKEISRCDFELGLLEHGARVALGLRRSCLTYSFDQYPKFIKEQQNITPEFWANAHNLATPPPAVIPEEPLAKKEPEEPSPMAENCYAEMLPLDWHSMTLPQRIEFVKRVNHEGFRKYILSTDEKIASHMAILSKYENRSDKMPMYITLMSFPAKSHSKDARELLKSFVKILNDIGRARLQYVETTDPRTVEIREVRI